MDAKSSKWYEVLLTDALILVVGFLALALLLILIHPAQAHDIYSGVKGKDDQLCCGGSDCSRTVYRERGGGFEVLSRENHWIEVPQDKITFLPVPGDEIDGTSHLAHFCYRESTNADQTALAKRDHLFLSRDGIQSVWHYCTFIPPGGT
jgi:hypothetical protein